MMQRSSRFEVAKMIEQRAWVLLDPLRVEIAVNKWPPQLQEIMWRVISKYAARAADEAEREKEAAQKAPARPQR